MTKNIIRNKAQAILLGELFRQLNDQGINYLYMKLSVVINQKLSILYFLARKRASAATLLCYPKGPKLLSEISSVKSRGIRKILSYCFACLAFREKPLEIAE